MTDEHWEQVKAALRLKAESAHTQDPAKVFELIRDNWELFCDQEALAEFVEAGELAQLRAARALQQEDLTRLDTRIDTLAKRRKP